MRNLFFPAIAALAIAAPASAQSMDEGQPSDFFNGFYVGGTFGLDVPSDRDTAVSFDRNRDGTYGDTVTTVAGANAFSPGFCDGAARGRTPGEGCQKDRDDYGYSIRAGYDTRLGEDGMFVAGVLVEAAKSEATDYVTAFSTTPANYVFSRGVDHSFTARGRLGISPGEGRGLFYVTGGVGFAKMEHGFSTSNGANSFTQNNADEYAFGAQLGGGAELVVANNISIAFEYLHQTFDDSDYFVAVGPGTAPATNPFLLAGGGTNMRPANTDYTFDSFRVGLNFRF